MDNFPDRHGHYSSPEPQIPADWMESCPRIRNVHVGIGEKVIVAANLFIDSSNSNDDLLARQSLVDALRNWSGPGSIVIAGNLVDLISSQDGLGEVHENGLFPLLDSIGHCTNTKIYVIPGFRDASLAYDRKVADQLLSQFRFQLALQIRLEIETVEGTRSVLVTSGREFDPFSRSQDVYSPLETPWAYHLLSEFWPKYLSGKDSNWLEGAKRLSDPGAASRFVLSRIVYRRAWKFLPWTLFPLALSYLLKIPLILSLPVVSRFRNHAADLAPRLLFIGGTTVIDVLVVSIIFLVFLRRSYSRFLADDASVSRAGNSNLEARLAAAPLLESGIEGVIVGHFISPELSKLGPGFFAAAGAVSLTYYESDALFGLPSVFRPVRQSTWIEIETGASMHVGLISRTLPLPPKSFSERLAIGRLGNKHPSGRIGSYPDGTQYREERDRHTADRTHRRAASTAIFLIAAFNLASAITPPLRHRIHILEEFLPIAVSQTADALVAMSSIGLVFLAGAVRRGQRQAWAITLGLALGTAGLNLIKGGDFEEAIALVILSLYLAAKRSSFTAPMDRPSAARSLRTIILGVTVIVVFSASTIFAYLALFTGHHLGYLDALAAVAERLVGVTSIPLPHRLNLFATPALELSGIAIAAISIAILFRPAVDRSRGLSTRFGTRTDRDRARAIVKQHSKGTLDYFALRDDKKYFFAHGCVIAYANYGSVSLVSPDPVGPETTKLQAWREFLAFANAKGWVAAVLGADGDWLENYRETGMRNIYVGDEAIVDLNTFSLEGKRNKGLRQAVNRIERYGYTADFGTPGDIDSKLRGNIRSLATHSRRGPEERGFSMTLGRIADPSDDDLLLTICRDKDAELSAFCQWVPAPGINGYSLDIMRRDLARHPNGLVDFMIASTIDHLRESGFANLSLNFATMRAVLAGETEAIGQRVEKWLLKRMSDSMQIESLWKFNSKFSPAWHPRYVVFDDLAQGPAVAAAIARAEAFWELPLLGRFLVPGETEQNLGESPSISE